MRKTPTRCTITLKTLKDFIYSLVHCSTCFRHCCAHHQEPFLHCTRSLCSPCDVRFDVASSLVQVLVRFSVCDHQEPFLHCTRSLCSPCDVRFDVASSLVQVLVRFSVCAGAPAHTEYLTKT